MFSSQVFFKGLPGGPYHPNTEGKTFKTCIIRHSFYIKKFDINSIYIGIKILIKEKQFQKLNILDFESKFSKKKRKECFWK